MKCDSKTKQKQKQMRTNELKLSGDVVTKLYIFNASARRIPKKKGETVHERPLSSAVDINNEDLLCY